SYDAVRMEGFQRVIFFAYTHELDRLAGDVADGERRPAPSIAIHLGEDYAGDRKLLVEFLRGADCVLAGHGVRDEQDLRGVQDLLERFHFGHQLIINVET